MFWVPFPLACRFLFLLSFTHRTQPQPQDFGPRIYSDSCFDLCPQVAQGSRSSLATRSTSDIRSVPSQPPESSNIGLYEVSKSPVRLPRTPGREEKEGDSDQSRRETDKAHPAGSRQGDGAEQDLGKSHGFSNPNLILLSGNPFCHKTQVRPSQNPKSGGWGC